jgi:hypothetical protein
MSGVPGVVAMTVLPVPGTEATTVPQAAQLRLGQSPSTGHGYTGLH